MKLRFKPLAMMLVGLIVISVFMTGCNSAELGYLNLNREILGLNVYEATSTVSIVINKLPFDKPGNNNAFVQSIINTLLAEYSLNCDQKVDYNKNVATSNFYLLNKMTGARQELVDFVCSGETLYVNVSQLKNILGLFVSSGDTASLDRVLDGVTWISCSEQDFNQMMPWGAAGGIGSAYNLSIARNRRQTILLYQLLDALSQKALQEFSSGVVAQQGNTFKISLNAREASDLIKSLLTYSVNHIDQVGEGLKTFLQGLTVDDLAELGLTDEQRRDMLAGIDQMVGDVSANPEQYLSGLDESLDASALGDSALYMMLAKMGSRAYRRTTGLVLDIVPPGKRYDEISLSFNGEDTIRAIPSFQADVPSQGVITFTQLQARMPITMNIDIDYGLYSVNQGFNNGIGEIDSRIVNGRVYLPIRKVGEALNENVGWDAVAKRAFIVHDGQAIDMDGIIIDGSTYVKIRDFEKLGYQVDWNPQKRAVVITKQPDGKGSSPEQSSNRLTYSRQSSTAGFY